MQFSVSSRKVQLDRPAHGWNISKPNNQSASIEIIHQNNIVKLLKKYNVSIEVDFFSEDTEYADYWIMEEVFLANYRPKIVIVEVN